MSEFLAFDVPECHNCTGPRRDECQNLFGGAIERRRALNKEYARDYSAIINSNRVDEMLAIGEEIHDLETSTLYEQLRKQQCLLSPDAVLYRLLISCMDTDV